MRDEGWQEVEVDGSERESRCSVPFVLVLRATVLVLADRAVVNRRVGEVLVAGFEWSFEYEYEYRDAEYE